MQDEESQKPASSENAAGPGHAAAAQAASVAEQSAFATNGDSQHQMNDIDSIVMTEDASSLQQQSQPQVRQGWGEQVAEEGVPVVADQAEQVDMLDEDDEAAPIEHRGRLPQAQQQTQNMLVDEQIELDDVPISDHEEGQNQQPEPAQVEQVMTEEQMQTAYIQMTDQLALNCATIYTTIKNNTEPTREIESIVEEMTKNSQQIIYAIRNVCSPEQSAELIKQFGQMTTAMLEEHIIMDSSYLVEIFKYFHALIVLYFPPLMDRQDMCVIVESIWKDRATLYQAVYPQSQKRTSRTGTNIVNKNNAQEDKKREEFRNQLEFESQKKLYARVESESDWRNSLGEGDYLDAITHYKTPQSASYNFICGWAQAKVIQADDRNIIVSFLGLMDGNRKIQRESLEIAPPKKFTDNITWRSELQMGDKLDTCDDYGIWYKSTLASRYTDEDNLDCDGKPIEMLHIVCRYADPEGQKVKDGVKVTGWLKDEFDLILEVNSIAVRQFESYSCQYYNVGNDDMKYDLDVTDQEDQLFQTEELVQFANARKVQFFGGIKYFATMIDDFGSAGGFGRILVLFDQIKEGLYKISVEHISLIVTFLANTMPFWTREFMCTEIGQFVKKFLSVFLTNEATNPLNMPHTRGHINIMINNYHMFLRRYYTPRKHQKMINHVNSLIGCSLLKMENLEKRIFGIKLISDQIGNLPYMDQSRVKKEEIMQDLLELKAFEIIFSPHNYHQQILQRAEDVLRLYAQMQSLTPELVDTLWETSRVAEVACISVYNIIGECIFGMQKEIIIHFINKVKEIPPSQLLLRDIKLVYNIGKSSTHTAQARYCADALWEIVFNERPGYTQAVLKVARKKLCELLKIFDTTTKIEFINQSIDHISDPTVISLQVLKILYKTISWLPKAMAWMNSTSINMKTLVTDLYGNQQLFDVLLQDLEAYKEKAWKEWQPDNLTDSNVFSPKTIETFPLFGEGFTHAKNLDVRMNGILFILETVAIKGPLINAQQLQRIWDILVGGNKLPGDQRAFFGFLRRVLQEREWLESSLVCQFFEDKIENNVQIVDEISVDGFLSIQTMFLYINEFKNYITIIKQPIEEKKTGESSFNKSSSSNRRSKSQRNNDGWQNAGNSQQAGKSTAIVAAKGKLEFRVHKHPNQLRGIEILWLLFQRSPSRDLDLLSQVVNFLAQVYHSISRVLESQRKAIYTDFVQESLQKLKNCLESLDSDSQKKDFVKNTMVMLMHSLTDTEVTGSAAIRPHFNIDQPHQTIEDITVQNYLTREGQPKYFTFSVDSSMTVWEFIDFIASKLNLSPRKIKVQRAANNTMSTNSKKPEFTAFTHCNTLAEMKVESSEEFNVMRNLNNAEKVALVNIQTQEMVPDVRLIFEEWFDTYARLKEDFEDADQLTDEKYMDKTACVAFMISTVKAPSQQSGYVNQAQEFTLTENSPTITNLYAEYDIDEDGRLTKEDFLRFYESKCRDNPSVVWKNLEKHNIGKDLNYGFANDIDLTYSNDRVIIRNQEDLPRFFISANKEYFNQLFSMDKFLANAGGLQYQQETMESVWKLIGRLKTNPQLYLSMLKNENLEERLGRTEEVDSYRLLYSLQIIYSLVENYRDKSGSVVTLYLENNKPLQWGGAVNGNGQQNPAVYNQNFPSLGEKEETKENEEQDNTNKLFGITEVNDDTGKDINGLAADQESVAGLLTAEKGASGATSNVVLNKGVAIPLLDEAAVENTNISNPNSTLDRHGKIMTHSKRQILSWKGDILKESLEISQVSDQELIAMITQQATELQDEDALEAEMILANTDKWLKDLKANWLVEFIANKGFEHLLTIMRTIVTKYSNSEKSEILNKKAEVNNLKLVAHLIKVLLIACFCSQTEDSNLVGNLQRKMSSVNEENAPLEQENVQTDKSTSDFISKQQDLSNEYKLLSQVLSSEPETASQLLSSINLPELQDLLQLTLRLILKKQSLINDLDRQVVAECLDIWVSCITYKNELILNIYGEDVTSSTEIVKMLIEDGLFSELTTQRRQFKGAIEFLCFNIKTGSLPQTPSIFFLKKLLGQIDNCKKMSFTKTPEFFELLIKLVQNYFAMRDRDSMNFEEIFDPVQLIKDLINQLNEYNSQESKTSIIPDHTLVGIINLAQTLLIANNDILDQAECSNIMNMLIKKCLFNQAQEAYPGHISDAIDLTSHQSSQINKCHTDESRNAAYSLLDTVINSNSDPRLIQTLVEDFWNPFILQLNKQKEAGGSQGRSPYRFAGLKNLSSICYMNSMIQQMFNVPSFRYSMLAADDRQPADWQDDPQGKKVDNNSLHQWLKMFSFLQLTDRQEYNPVDYCFAFKDYGGNPTNVRVQQDAQEYLNLAFDRLENMLKDTPQKYICQNVFQGQMSSILVCKNCGNIVCTDQPFYNLQTNVKNQKTLQASLESMISGEMIDDYNCSSCKQKVTIEKKQCVRNMPNTLIVHLNRIVFDFDTMRNVKLNDKLEFPNELNVRPFMLHQVLADMKKTENEQADLNDGGNNNEDAKQDDGEDQAKGANGQNSAAQNDGPSIDEDEEEKAKREQDNQILQDLVKEGQKMAVDEFDYKLVGVVIHMGVADAGHYLSYINTERESDSQAEPRQWSQTDKQTWLEFNDTNVSSFDFTQMQYKAFGEDTSTSANAIQDYNQDFGGINEVQRSHNAYMLVYEKAKKKPLKIVCSEDNINLIKSQPRSVIQKVNKLTQGENSALSCDGTAIPRDIDDKEEIKQEEGRDSDVTMQSTATSAAHASAQSVSKSDMPTVISDAEMSNSEGITKKPVEAEEDKEMEDFMAKVPHSFLIYPNLISSIYDNSDTVVKYDEEMKEHYTEVPFHQVQKFVPNEYYRLVHNDNQLFLAEKQVFCTPFFKTSAQMIEQYLNSIDQESAVSQEDADAKRMQVFQVLDKLIFDMLVDGTESQQQNLPQMTELFFRVINQSNEALFNVINNRILVGIDDPNQLMEEDTQQIDTGDNAAANNKQKTLEDKTFLDMFICGKTSQVRELAETVLSNVMLTLFSKLDSEEPMVDKNQIEELIERIIGSLLDLIPNEVQKYFHKLGPFFNFFYTMIKDLDLRRVSYFLRSGLIHRLIDLAGRYNSQVEYSVPPFDKLVATVCILARCQPMIVYLFGIPEEFQPSEDEIKAEISQSPVSPNWIYYTPEGQEPIVHEYQSPMMSLVDIRKLILTDKRTKEFFSIALKNTQESKSVAQLIGHLCWGNYEISRRFGKIILKGLNSTNELEVKPYVDCMTTYLSLNDQFQEERIEWLMGISNYNIIQQKYGYNNSVNKAGISQIQTIEDQIVEYSSNLFKTKTEIDEPVLRMMYNYRKERYVRAMLALLEGVTWVMATADKDNVLLKYLLTIDPPAYTCRRYWDWIEPHVLDHIQSCADQGVNVVTSTDELETSMRIYSNIEQIKNQFGDLIAVDDELKLTEQGDNGRAVPDPYLMWQIKADQQIARFPDDDAAPVTVTVHECICEVSTSRPDGRVNASIERTWHDSRIKFVPRRQKKKPQGRASGHGRGAQRTQAKGWLRNRNKDGKSGKKSSKQEHIVGHDSQDADDSDNEDPQDANAQAADKPVDWEMADAEAGQNGAMDSRYEDATAEIADEKEAVPNVQAASQPSGQGTWADDLASPQDKKQQDNEPVPTGEGTNDQENSPIKQVQNVEMFEEPIQEPEPAPVDQATDENMAENQQAGDNEEAKVEEPEQEEELILKNPYKMEDQDEEEEKVTEKEEIPDDPKSDLPTLLVLMVTNQSRRDAKVTIRFNQENRKTANIRIPKTDFTEVFLGSKNKLPLRFGKLKLNEPWGAFDFRVLVDDQDVMTDEKVDRFSRDFPHLRQAKLPMVAAAAEADRDVEQQQQDEGLGLNLDDLGSSVNATGGTTGPPDVDVAPEDFGKINCAICTFLNSPHNTQCEICGSPM